MKLVISNLLLIIASADLIFIDDNNKTVLNKTHLNQIVYENPLKDEDGKNIMK